MSLRWLSVVASLTADYPALMHALPHRLTELRQGATVGLAADGVRAQREWLATAQQAEVHAAALHLAAHAALGHRPWRVALAGASAALDVEVQQFLRDCGVPETLARWQGDHHGAWLGAPETKPGEAWMARPEAPQRLSERVPPETTIDEAAAAEDPSDSSPMKAADQQQDGAGAVSGGGRGRAWLEPPASPPDWRALLRLWLTRRVYQRRQFDRPSRRAAPPLVLPRLSGRQYALVLAIDVSGSIDPRWIGQFLVEAERLRAQLPLTLRLMTCDNRIHEDRMLWSLARQDESAGGGGTDFRPVFDRIAHDATVDALIYCTDLSGTWPMRAPPFPVFWLVPWLGSAGQAAQGQRPVPPFGTVLWMNAA